MSGNVARAAPGSPRPSRPQRPPMQIVPGSRQRRARPKVHYAIVAVAGIAVIAVGQLLLSITLSEGAYEIATLQASQTQLDRTTGALAEDLDRVSSPQSLAANAEALGMVSNANPVYLRLSDGAVLGSPVPATGAAGTVTRGAAAVPNALLAGVPLVAAAVPGAPVAGDAPTLQPEVPLQSGLPSPTTH